MKRICVVLLVLAMWGCDKQAGVLDHPGVSLPQQTETRKASPKAVSPNDKAVEFLDEDKRLSHRQLKVEKSGGSNPAESV